ANATMIDSDNVLLLHPATATSGFSFGNKERPRAGANEARRELIVATIYCFDAPMDAPFVEFFERTVKPAVIGSGATVLAFLVTEHSENTFPALPVREGENVFVWFARFNDAAAYERHIAALTQYPRWRGEILKELARRLKREPEILKLSPTTRSLLYADGSAPDVGPGPVTFDERDDGMIGHSQLAVLDGDLVARGDLDPASH